MEIRFAELGPSHMLFILGSQVGKVYAGRWPNEADGTWLSFIGRG